MASAATLEPSPSSGGFLREDGPALALVVAAHVALFAALTWFSHAAPPPPVPPRMQVTISNEIAPNSTSPNPAAQAAPDIAPTRGEPAPAPEPLPVAKPEPVEEPAPAPVPVSRPAPRVVPKLTPAPARHAAPAPKPVARPAPPHPAARPAPAPKPAHVAPRAAAPSDDRPRRRPDAPSGASMIGKDFLKGIPSGNDIKATAKAPPAAAIGPAVKASIGDAIAQQLLPHWTAPQGVDAEKLVTILAFDLNPDGSLAGPPRLVSQSGITDANRAQAGRHAELAMRAVRLAAPFKLPAQYYAVWKHIGKSRFDRNLGQ